MHDTFYVRTYTTIIDLKQYGMIKSTITYYL